MDKDRTIADITEREQQILRSLIDQYIRDGQPVGSRTLSRVSGLKLSPATMRNVMYDLENMGLLVSPHTSAGRVPTALGYRVFVDRMLEVQPLERASVESIRAGLASAGSEQALIRRASSVLSGFTQMAGLVTVPKKNVRVLQQIEFLPLSDRRLLVILVINEKDVQNRVVHVDRDYSKAELETFSTFISNKFRGRPLDEIRQTIKDELRQSRDDMTAQMQRMVEMAGQMFDEGEDEDGEGDMIVDGQTNLMGCADLADMETLRELFEAFNSKRDMYYLLEQCITADGVQVFIGKESGYSVLDECSLVTAPYKVEGDVVGVLGVVGPTRMAYDRVVPVVDITSRLLSAALNS
ncbi:heat-inducible transcriptional repressor HrcA [Granulosicoccaceae sp. 1_MG-2023]|nr:heat-inducible transcriptional repressor HrcA [Granulosicoccaceae sp. 1_MG-2023]